ncbi:MAG: LysM peptidoglycan-binding domain-containing protein [Bdellovibrio sp.]|nr:LysM peptidoglycan-binding domain-containing protein [Bdellovibrio sp.]
MFRSIGHTLFLILILMACSSNEKKAETAASASGTTTAMESDAGDDDLFDDEKDEESDVNLFESKPEKKVGKSKKESAAIAPVEISGDAAEYTVEKGDTLMLIAFKLYGDYAKWKLLAGYNPNLSESGLAQGMVIKYQTPSEKFTWAPQGDPHLIRPAETLGSISKDKYGIISKWKDIFENNRPMIKNPNLIFAGFTIYYVPDERSVASEKQ